jgi:hypothetical protein
MELRRELELLYAAMLVDDGVFVLRPLEREQLVILVHAELVTVIAQVLDNFRVWRLLRVRVRSLEVRIAMVRLE